MNEDKEVLKVDMGAEGTKTIKSSFPSNSHKEKIEGKKEDVDKKITKVISGTVVQKKKSLGKRFMETFVNDDITNIKSYVFHDVLIPAAKDTISDIVQGITDTIQGSIDVTLFGETRRRGSSRNKRDSGRGYVSYNNYSSSRDKDKDRKDSRRDISSRDRARHNFNDIILSSRGDAEEVLSCLVDLIIDYNEATVADLYELVGVTGEFTDRRYGWKDLSSASVSRARDGYMLNLPRTVLLD